jgi:hypothetical protein
MPPGVSSHPEVSATPVPPRKIPFGIVCGAGNFTGNAQKGRQRHAEKSAKSAPKGAPRTQVRGAKTAEKIGSCANSRNETGNGVQNVRGLDVPGRVAATKPRANFFCGSQDALSRGKWPPAPKGRQKGAQKGRPKVRQRAPPGRRCEAPKLQKKLVPVRTAATRPGTVCRMYAAWTFPVALLLLSRERFFSADPRTHFRAEKWPPAPKGRRKGAQKVDQKSGQSGGGQSGGGQSGGVTFSKVVSKYDV